MRMKKLHGCKLLLELCSCFFFLPGPEDGHEMSERVSTLLLSSHTIILRILFCLQHSGMCLAEFAHLNIDVVHRLYRV